MWSFRAWKKLKAVLQSWKQTSGQYDQSEKAAVCQEIKEVRLFISFCSKPKTGDEDEKPLKFSVFMKEICLELSLPQ